MDNIFYANFIHSKLWLLYLHEILHELGDRATMDCCYAELPDDILFKSSDMDEANMKINPKKGKVQKKIIK